MSARKESIQENTLIYILAETKHAVTNTGIDDMLILCICIPPYMHGTKIT